MTFFRHRRLGLIIGIHRSLIRGVGGLVDCLTLLPAARELARPAKAAPTLSRSFMNVKNSGHLEMQLTLVYGLQPGI